MICKCIIDCECFYFFRPPQNQLRALNFDAIWKVKSLRQEKLKTHKRTIRSRNTNNKLNTQRFSIYVIEINTNQFAWTFVRWIDFLFRLCSFLVTQSVVILLFRFLSLPQKAFFTLTCKLNLQVKIETKGSELVLCTIIFANYTK